MDYCKLIPELKINDGKLIVTNTTINKNDIVELCEQIDNMGADELLIFEKSQNDSEHDNNIGMIKQIVSATDIPLLLGGNIKRLEDVKKYLYAGAMMAVLNASLQTNLDMIKEASDRFGAEKIAIFDKDVVDSNIIEKLNSYADQGASLLITTSEISSDVIKKMSNDKIAVLFVNNEADINNVKEKFVSKYVYGFSSKNIFDNSKNDFMKVKKELNALNVSVNIFESSMKFSEFKLNSDGHLTVVVQDYKTNEVLMVAYMNEEAFNKTIETGRMTYYSRSRNELWIKGLTSGHYQYVKALTIDCDNDTLLAKVKQVGAACHTGNKTCFFNTIVKKEYDETNPLMVFEDVFNVIKDRKVNPKEGSYTNYLFDKGIDKILKKVGEEATEIVIAAKNPDPEEIKYEISDFLYHVMVLMAERGVSWEDITKELARR